jgi:hypothetical protein
MHTIKRRIWPRVYVAVAAAVPTALAIYALAAPFDDSH